MIKRVLAVFCVVSLLFGCCLSAAALPLTEGTSAPSVSAKSAVLIEAESETILFEKNAHLPMGMASTTKIMTALVALERCDPQRAFSVPAEAVGVEGSSVYLTAGESLTMKELLYALLLSSANDAALAIAICVGGSEEGFCALMNERAKKMGLESTRFENPHGLYHEEHYTTAYELSRIAAEAMRHPLFRQIVSTYKQTIPAGGVPNARLLVNHNKLLRTYEGAIGVKTGFTKKTGRTLVSAAERDGMTLIAVTLDAPDDWRDHAAMLDYGFATYERVTVAEQEALRLSVPVTGGTAREAILTNREAISLILPKGAAIPALTVERTARFLFAPVLAGDSCGTVSVRIGKQASSSPLVIKETVESAKKPFRFFFTLPFGREASQEQRSVSWNPLSFKNFSPIAVSFPVAPPRRRSVSDGSRSMAW